MEPPAPECFLGRPGQVVVTPEQRGAPQEDLPVGLDPQGRARKRAAHVRGVVVADALSRGGPGGLRESVPLDDGDPHATEEVCQVLGQGSPSADDVPQLVAQGRAHLGEHQPVRHCQCPARTRTDALGPGTGLGDTSRLARRPGEDLATHPAPGLRSGRVVDLLQHAGHHEHARGAEGGDVGQQAAGVGGESHRPPSGDERVDDETREDVGQGQEHQHAGVGAVEDLGEDVPHPACHLHEIRLGELHSLGLPGGARRVHDGRQVIRPRRRASPLRLAPGGTPGRGSQVLQPTPLQAEEVTERGPVRGAHQLRLLSGVRDDHGHVGVGEDVPDL